MKKGTLITIVVITVILALLYETVKGIAIQPGHKFLGQEEY